LINDDPSDLFRDPRYSTIPSESSINTIMLADKKREHACKRDIRRSVADTRQTVSRYRPTALHGDEITWPSHLLTNLKGWWVHRGYTPVSFWRQTHWETWRRAVAVVRWSTCRPIGLLEIDENHADVEW